MNWIKSNLHKQRMLILGNESPLLIITAIAGLWLALS
jgi:hypothetical protein